MGGTGEPAECVVNFAEGRDRDVVTAVCAAGGDAVLDLHTDPDHHRSVLTLAGPLETVELAARDVAAAAVERIDLRTHRGVHPRFGAVDVVPFVPLGDSGRDAAPPLDRVLGARDRFARWAGTELGLPCFLYGPERPLPEVRRGAFSTLAPDTGPPRPHPTAGAVAVGARPVLVAYNLWLSADGSEGGPAGPLAAARAIAAGLRGPAVRALGLAAGSGAQVSLNLVEPAVVTVADAYDAVARAAPSHGCRVERAELVGLLPAALLHAVPPNRWSELDLREEATIERRLASPGLRPGHRSAG